MRVEVLQYIFGNVPKDKSPSGRRGYQTLFYTRSGLSEEDIILLEERAQYYSPSTLPIETAPEKYQFYTLADNRAVMSRIIPLPELDEFGRSGRYLAHSLIISSADFERLGYCPLGMLKDDLFCSNLDAVFDLGDFQSGNIPPKIVESADEWEDLAVQSAHDWSGKELLELVKFGWQAESLKGNHESVGVFGKTDKIFRLLSIIFLLSLPKKRLHLTFDTYAFGCNWTRNWPFWVWGSDNLSDFQTTYQVDADNRQVILGLSQRQLTSFEKWVVKDVIPTKLDHYINERDQALLLDQALKGYQLQLSDLTRIDESFAKSYCRLNETMIINRIFSMLPGGLSKGILNAISLDISEDPWGYLKLLLRDGSSEWIPQLFEAVLLETPKIELSKNDKRILSSLAKDTTNSALDGLLKFMSGDMDGWKKSLVDFSDKTYQYIVKPLIERGFITASGAFSPSHMTTWCQEFAKYYQPGEIRSILKDLDKYQITMYVDQLECVLLYMNYADKETLRRWLKKNPSYAPNLKAFFRAKPAEPEGIGDKLKRRLFGKKDAGKTH